MDEITIALDTTDPASTFASLAIVIAEIDERRREAEDSVARQLAQLQGYASAYARWAELLKCLPNYQAIDARIVELTQGG